MDKLFSTLEIQDFEILMPAGYWVKFYFTPKDLCSFGKDEWV